MNAFRVDLYSTNDGGSETATVDLGRRQEFLAWTQINLIDSTADFDRDNAVAVDIFQVDGNRTGWRVAGGDHFGDPDTAPNVHEGALAGFGQRITFRIRAMHKSDLAVYGTGIVLTP